MGLCSDHQHTRHQHRCCISCRLLLTASKAGATPASVPTAGTTPFGPQLNLGLLRGPLGVGAPQSLAHYGNPAAAAAGVGGSSSMNTGPQVSNTLHGVCLCGVLGCTQQHSQTHHPRPALGCTQQHSQTHHPVLPCVFAHAQVHVPAAGGSGMQPGSSSGGADNTRAQGPNPLALVRDCVLVSFLFTPALVFC